MKDVDLNLLPSLQALLELRNVSRAAERMHLSQSSMSASLGRLRRHFNDELLVRAGRGYELTQFAEALAPRVDRAMADVQEALQLHAGFAPSTSDRTFVIAASDYVASVLLRHLRARMTQEAPGIRVDVVPTSRPISTPHVFNQVDLVIGPMGFALPGDSRALFRDDFVVLLDPAHPLLAADRLTVADVAAAPQAIGEFGGSIITPPMRFFAEVDQAPRVAARISGFQALPSIVEGTDLVALVPRRLAARAVRDGRLVAIAVADELEIPLVEGMFWHPLQSADPGNTWLRDVVRRAADAMEDPRSTCTRCGSRQARRYDGTARDPRWLSEVADGPVQRGVAGRLPGRLAARPTEAAIGTDHDQHQRTQHRPPSRAGHGGVVDAAVGVEEATSSVVGQQDPRGREVTGRVAREHVAEVQDPGQSGLPRRIAPRQSPLDGSLTASRDIGATPGGDSHQEQPRSRA